MDDRSREYPAQFQLATCPCNALLYSYVSGNTTKFQGGIAAFFGGGPPTVMPEEDLESGSTGR